MDQNPVENPIVQIADHEENYSIELDVEAVQKWRDRVLAGHKNFRRVNRDRLVFVTVIGGAMAVTPTTTTMAITDWTASVIEAGRDGWHRTVRRRLPGLRWRGSWEVDLLRPTGIKAKGHKADLLQDLGVDVRSLTPDHRILLPHFHVVADLGTHDQKVMSGELRVPFSGRWRVHSTPLWDSGTVEDNLTGIASYSTKLRFRYSSAYGGKVTEYNEDYEGFWRTKVIQVIQSISLDGLEFRSSL